MAFLNSAPSQYVVQTFLHSLIAAILISLLLKLWRIRQPQIKGKFLLLIWLLPLACLPLYYLIYPERYSLGFRQGAAFFDINQWLSLKIASIYPLAYLLALLMAITTILLLLQEVMPLLRSRLFSPHRLFPLKEGQFPTLDSSLKRLGDALGRPLPPLLLATEGETLIYTSGTLQPALVLSPSLIDTLEEEELEAVLAHEIAHILKGDHRLGWFFLALRCLVFYNPVALIASRRLLWENEKICDDIAISLVPNPTALASGLLKAYRGGPQSPSPSFPSWSGRLSSPIHSLESRAGKAQVEERLERLLDPGREKAVPLANLRLAVTALTLGLLLFFVV